MIVISGRDLKRSPGISISLTLSNFIRHKKNVTLKSNAELIISSRLKLVLDSAHVMRRLNRV